MAQNGSTDSWVYDKTMYWTRTLIPNLLERGYANKINLLYLNEKQ